MQVNNVGTTNGEEIDSSCGCLEGQFCAHNSAESNAALETVSLSPKPAASGVFAVAAAKPYDAVAHFSKRLEFETDCSDVNYAFVSRTVDFVLLDVRGPQLYHKGHVPGAINLPHVYITEERMSEYPLDTNFVVYCAGPHCNGANKAAIRLARLGRPVKEMIGGITGWLDEGLKLEKSVFTS